MDKEWQVHYEVGLKAFEEMNYRDAQYHLEAVIKKKDGFADVYNLLGVIYQMDENIDDAISMFKKALEINRAYTEAALNLSIAYNEKGEFVLAEDIYAEAKERERGEEDSNLDPYVKGKLANMHAELGSIYGDLAFYREAAEEYKKGLALRPEFADIRTKLGIAFRGMKDFSRAISEFEGALQIKPDYFHARLHLGVTYYLMNYKDKAKAEWLKVRHEAPDEKRADMYLHLVRDQESGAE
ncbi:MAG: tetratricopeptide repeat protein [Thermodesulfobacteriota bacterium]